MYYGKSLISIFQEFFVTISKTFILAGRLGYGLRKAIKSLRLPNTSGGCIVGALAENQIVKHDTRSILKTFKSFYSNLAGDLLAKLLKSPNGYTIKSVSITKNFHYQKILNWTQ